MLNILEREQGIHCHNKIDRTICTVNNVRGIIGKLSFNLSVKEGIDNVLLKSPRNILWV